MYILVHNYPPASWKSPWRAFSPGRTSARVWLQGLAVPTCCFEKEKKKNNGKQKGEIGSPIDGFSPWVKGALGSVGGLLLVTSCLCRAQGSLAETWSGRKEQGVKKARPVIEPLAGPSRSQLHAFNALNLHPLP